MTDSGRACRIASVSLAGVPVQAAKENGPRLELLGGIVETMNAKGWDGIDAVVLPGGFLKIGCALSRASHDDRVTKLANEPWYPAVMAAAKALHGVNKGAKLVFGVLGPQRRENEAAEQAVLAFDHRGFAGIGCKLFPSPAEAGDEAYLAPSADDYRSAHRFLKLPSGAVAILAAASDLFGVAAGDQMGVARTGSIRHLWAEHKLRSVGEPGFTKLKRSCLENWGKTVAAKRPMVALASVHGFAGPGRDGYWQRHGVALASHALGGGLAVAAAHFESELPGIERSTLAAALVPPSHRDDGPRRQAHRLFPLDAFASERDTVPVALTRLFQLDLVKTKDGLQPGAVRTHLAGDATASHASAGG